MTIQTAERVETDLSVIEALESDMRIACENQDECSNEARWSCKHKCCGNFTGFCCDKCRAEVIALMSAFYWMKTCRKCGTQCAPDAIVFEPIKARP